MAKKPDPPEPTARPSERLYRPYDDGLSDFRRDDEDELPLDEAIKRIFRQ